jgi:putative ABC transport system ATP-binding protein
MIEITNLYKSFKLPTETFHALQNINLTISRGEVVLIRGESGSGKSTLLSIIAAIMKPTSGEVRFKNENIVSLSDIHLSEYRKREVGFITQSFYLFDELTVEDNLLPPLIIRNITKEEINRLLHVAMKDANIEHKKKQKVNTLSGGERQRCIIARAIINNPEIIICDEPTANLDIENTLAFIEILKKLKENGKTIIISTHEQIFNQLNFIDKILTLKSGTLG